MKTLSPNMLEKGMREVYDNLAAYLRCDAAVLEAFAVKLENYPIGELNHECRSIRLAVGRLNERVKGIKELL